MVFKHISAQKYKTFKGCLKIKTKEIVQLNFFFVTGSACASWCLLAVVHIWRCCVVFPGLYFYFPRACVGSFSLWGLQRCDRELHKRLSQFTGLSLKGRWKWCSWPGLGFFFVTSKAAAVNISVGFARSLKSVSAPSLLLVTI